MATQQVEAILESARLVVRKNLHFLSQVLARQEPSDAADALARICRCLEGVSKTIDRSDAATMFDLGSVSEFSRQVNTLEGVINNGEDWLLRSGGTQVLWSHAAPLATFLTPFVFSAPAASGDPFEEVKLGRLLQLNQGFKEIDARVLASTEATTRLETQIAETLGRFSTQFSESEAERVRRYESESLDRVSAVRAAETQVNESVTEAKAAIASALGQFSVDKQTALQSLADARGKTLQELEEYKQKARAAVGAVGASAQAAAYEAVAEGAGRRSDWWQTGALATMGATVGIATYFVFAGTEFDLTPAKVAASISKLVLVVLLGVLSKYCASMATRARQEHLWSLQRAMEFRALNAYLEGFEESQRAELRMRLAEKYFGSGSTLLHEVMGKETPPTSSGEALVDLMRVVLEKLPAESATQLVSTLAQKTTPPKK